MVDDVTLSEALTHFIMMPWKLLFATVPPTHLGNGYPAFLAALVFIGFVVSIVGHTA